LAKKYPLANPNDLYIIQTELNSKQVPKEQINWIAKTLASGKDSSNNETIPEVQNPIINTQDITGFLQGNGFYFYNDVPGKTETTPQPYNYYYTSYVGNKQTYIKAAANEVTTTPYKSNSDIVSLFFTTVIEANYTKINENLLKIYNGIKANQYEKVVIDLIGTTSAPATQEYNLKLSERRNDSVKKYIRDFKPATEESTLNELAITNNIILSITKTAEGESSVSVKTVIGSSMVYDCGDQDSKSPSKQINTVNAMACRRVAIKNVTIVPRIKELANFSLVTSLFLSSGNVPINDIICSGGIPNCLAIFIRS
jgi:outer membrane protein OmpA-like peptidoglycan-associated protein